ncbi:Sulfate adenylyltransferase [Desulfamplus magnetovallimortis]|uniref:Sulfate adenylyltransferase n=1 Tax=Desulfamplus magnetovallimortis TaxID=1246637 RepID=A0A1W1H8Y4_9BACT|nr:bifunctional sulfate adenylyltransferase/adenylylsulfate kinase [Desulfamplus magnetovallimortis]SLM28922.1 Sulfate adenylyltransferase [Desulfamplus magnetovallimortis]
MESNVIQQETLPHGKENQLVDLIVDRERYNILKKLSSTLPDVVLNQRQLCDFEMLVTGAYSPLTGFMKHIDYETVLDRMRLSTGELWPVPICLDVPDSLGESLEAGQSVMLRDPEGFLLGMMNVEDIWPVDMEKEAVALFGTRDRKHPGVNYLYTRSGRFYIGGTIEAMNLPIHSDFRQLRRTPNEVRAIFAKLGWKRVVGFQTRHPIHRPQFEMTIQAMQKSGANLLLLPVAGETKPGDFDHFTRMRCYRKVSSHYPPDSFLLNLLPMAMRMAGPRDALLHLIMGKNFGCTHFIIGHDHSSPGINSNGTPFYNSEDAAALADEAAPEVGVKVISFKKMVYLPFEDEYRFEDNVPEKSETIFLSGTDIRKRIRAGKHVPEWATFPEVVEELKKSYPPPSGQGLTIFLTGLSGAGKSTIANVLYAKFMEIGTRPVTLLDGDIVRRNLSSELNFSREHRDINVRRIGFVATEITKNRGVAICAPIAPYKKTRAEIRESIEEYGGFFEVHVSTPIDECEKRDRKGMYARARAGLLKGFTGVDDPYEIPENNEITIDTTNITPDEAAHEILLFVGQKGYL